MKGKPKLDTETILQIVGAAYQSTLDAAEGDEREALQAIQNDLGMILDAFSEDVTERLHEKYPNRRVGVDI